MLLLTTVQAENPEQTSLPTIQPCLYQFLVHVAHQITIRISINKRNAVYEPLVRLPIFVLIISTPYPSTDTTLFYRSLQVKQYLL